MDGVLGRGLWAEEPPEAVEGPEARVSGWVLQFSNKNNAVLCIYGQSNYIWRRICHKGGGLTHKTTPGYTIVYI